MGEVTIRRLAVQADATGDQLVLLDALPFKEVIHWTMVVARDPGEHCSHINLVLMEGRTEYVLNHVSTAFFHHKCCTMTDFYAPGNFRVGARFVGAAEKDTLEVYAYGVVQRDFPIE